jgi:hypothetical protein
MDENTIRSVLRSDARVKELISARAYQNFLARNPDEGDPDNDWLRAEEEVIDELTDKLIEAQSESWRSLEQQQPGLQAGRTFSTLLGFMLANGSGRPSRSDLYDPRYYTIGLSYITGMFQIGQALKEDEFVRRFSNDNAVVAALLYHLRTSPESPYYCEKLPAELKVECRTDEEMSDYLAYAEEQARTFFDLFKQMLMAQSAAAAR